MPSWRDDPIVADDTPHISWTQDPEVQPMGAAESFGYGVGSAARGIMQLAQHALPPEARYVQSKPLSATEQRWGAMARGPENLDETIRQKEADYQARKPEGIDYAKMAGEIAATLPLAIAGGAGVIGGMAAGAAAGVAQPVVTKEGEADNYWLTKAEQAGFGAVGGAVAAGAGKVIGKVVRGVQNPAAKELMAEGITPTIGQAIGPRATVVEQKLTSVPGLGEAISGTYGKQIEQMNVAAYNRALRPIGVKASGVTGHEGVEEVRQTLSAAFDEIAPKLKLAPNTLEADVAPVVAKAADYLPERELGRLQEILGKARTKGNFKEAEEYLDFFATKYKRAPDPDMQSLGESLDSVLTSARGSLAKQNPAYASRLKAINEGWANYDVIRRAAGSTGSREGVFSAEQLNTAVKAHAVARGGQARGLGEFAGGQALMQDLARPAMRIMGKRFPDSGTASRLGYMGAGYTAALHPEALAVGALTALPYASPLTRKMAAAALLRRPSSAEMGAKAAQLLGRGAAPGVGLVLAEAGAP